MRQAVNVPLVVGVLAVIISGAVGGMIGAPAAILIASGIELTPEQNVFPRLDNS
jgi:ABC-type dipeptide/oligopeptide/nickel transport system permease subunit